MASAAAWVPSATCTIASIPLAGMATSILINNAFGAVLTFFVFWLVFGATMKEYPLPGGGAGHYCRAPAYLAATCVGMVGMIYAERLGP